MKKKKIEKKGRKKKKTSIASAMLINDISLVII
jgi:hypothetical protein